MFFRLKALSPNHQQGCSRQTLLSSLATSAHDSSSAGVEASTVLKKKKKFLHKTAPKPAKIICLILTPTSSSPASRRPRRTESRATRVPRARRCRRRGKGEGGLRVGKTGGDISKRVLFLFVQFCHFTHTFAFSPSSLGTFVLPRTGTASPCGTCA